ncbi:MAG: hypothetical protein JXP39_00170 [Spirochaetales bacterium]|nr:hypothetical protein [Spirochaetales bacterium]HPO02797.1 anaerobic ribonucleoside-triphosphate reductase [Treponemataceae bacterium]
MRTVTEIDADIARVRAEMQNVHGTTTEVYARIVGYYRSVRNWNRGKREEYNHRKLFIADEQRIEEHMGAFDLVQVPGKNSNAVISETCAIETAQAEGEARYELYVRKTCPNCPPVKECCTSLPLSGEQIDVDTPEGFARASALGVFSAPTVIFFDQAGHETGRAHSVKEIRSLSNAYAGEPVLSF